MNEHHQPALSKEPKFAVGDVVATTGASAACDFIHLVQCLEQHMLGDWGSVCAEDAASNNDALAHGGRILSAYPIDPQKPRKGFGSNTLWIITEADRSVTIFLLPSKY